MPRRSSAVEKRDSFDRMLSYYARHSGWIIFRSIYWSIYLLFLGSTLLYYSTQNQSISIQTFFGFALSLLAIMFIVYGFTETLHHKLMKTYS